jgi:uncharacterized paraquat-inducible protein A
MSRYSKKCPGCGAVILPSELSREDSFQCPSCGEWLTYDKRYTTAIWAVSVAVAIFISLHMGYRDVTFILVTAGATWILGLLGLFIVGILIPPPLQIVRGKPFDKTVSLHLGEKPDAQKKSQS